MLLEVVFLLLVARAFGELARRLGQPQVIGELLAGVALGPSFLGWLWPQATARLFPSTGLSPQLLGVLTELGVVLLLLLSGLDVDLELVRQRIRPAVVIALAGVALPFVAGYALAVLLLAPFAGPAARGAIFPLFVATSMSISAIPVIVKILLDMRLMRRDIGQLTVAAGVISDSTGWLLLSLIAGAATGRGVPLTSFTVTLAELAAFVLFTFTLGYRLLRWAITWVDDHLGAEDATLSAVLLAGLAGAAVTQALHLEAFLGAFLIGIQLARVPRVGPAVRTRLRAMTLAVFAPLFFAAAGLRVSIPALLQPRALAAAAALIAVACLAKFAGTFLGARLSRLNDWLALGLGAGMNARGAVEIILASAGLSLGILSQTMYSMIIVMAVLTSMLAPPLLRWALRRAPVDPEEEERLRREAWQARSFLHGLRRMLVPVRDGRYALVAARVVSHLAMGRTVEAVALHVGGEGPPLPTEPEPGTEDKGAGRVLWTRRQIPGTAEVAAAVVAEAARGYDLLVVGGRPASSRRGLFGAGTDAIVRRAPCSVFVLSTGADRAPVDEVRRILFPTAGSSLDRRGAEFAVALARGMKAEVVCLHVVEQRPLWSSLGVGLDEVWRRPEELGLEATAEVVRIGEQSDVPVRPLVRTGVNLTAERVIVATAEEQGCQLIVLAAEPRSTGEELYCGRTVAYVVHRAPCPVAVLFQPGLATWSAPALTAGGEG